jgi:GT2 family glycosyltransferase
MTTSQKTDGDTIACVVLDWNGGRDTERCIISLLSSENVAIDILVVDNASSDGTPDRLVNLFPQITIFRQQSNLGVAKGFNLGIEWAMAKGHRAVFFLNNDATVHKDCLSTMKQLLDADHSLGIVSPRIIDGTQPGKMWFDGGKQNAFGDPVHMGFSQLIGLQIGNRTEDFATGCAMLVRAHVFEDVGGFGEQFFAYSEDVDFSHRARKHGWRILHVPRANVVHYPSSATKRNRGKWFRDYYVTRNKLLLLRNELSGTAWLTFLLYFGVRYVLVPSCFFLATAQFKRLGAVYCGVYDFVLRRFGRRYS